MTKARFGLFAILASTYLAATAGCVMNVSDISPEAKIAIEERFPGATLQKAERKLGGAYEVTVRQGELVADVEIHKDGTIYEIEALIAAGDLPKPVADTFAEKAKGAELVKIEKVELLAKRGSGGTMKLDKPEVYYEAKWLVGIFKKELEVNPDGTVR